VCYVSLFCVADLVLDFVYIVTFIVYSVCLVCIVKRAQVILVKGGGNVTNVVSCLVCVLIMRWLGVVFACLCGFDLPSVLRCCWLGSRKGIRPVKKLSGGMLAWLSGMRCRLAYSPADATATHLL